MKSGFMSDSCSSGHDRRMADDSALRAHVLRRLTFGPRPGQVSELDGTAPTDLVEQLLAADAFEPDDPGLGSDDDYSRLPAWWISTMLDERAGLHERMVWFWHTHLTSSLAKSSPLLMYRQNQLLRTHALGNFRELLQDITVDAAMLYWLDGAGSRAEAPNENYAREVMELFALGREGGYTEADVRAGSQVFAGWWVDGDNGDEVRFDSEAGPTGAVDFLGRSVSNATEAVDAICDHPSCAPWIARAVHRFLTGEVPDDARLAELAAVFADSGLELRPLVENVVRHPSFLELRLNTPRSSLDWFLALRRLYDVDIDFWPLDGLGQVPFNPPNVAGWPGGARWTTVGVALGKAQVAYDQCWDTVTLDEDDPVGDVLARAGLYEVSDATRSVLDDASAAADDRRARSSLLHALVAVSPEFSIH
jgi:uncharacterized protein (DUF1800 family)